MNNKWRIHLPRKCQVDEYYEFRHIIEIDGKVYEVHQDTACLVHAILLSTDDGSSDNVVELRK